MSWKTLDHMHLSGKRVLTRVDINVPVEGGRVTDTTPVSYTHLTLPTICSV